MKKNTASQIVGCQMVSATDGSAFTGSVTCYVTGDGGTQAAGSVGSGACTHEGNGFYTYAPAQAETNYDHVAFTFTGTGAVPATVQVYPTFPQTGDSFARLGAPAGASVSADVAAVKSETAAIKAKTDNLPSDPADASVVAGLIAAVEAKVDTVDTVVDSVKAKTDNLPSDPADASVVAGLIAAVEAKVDTVDSNVDAILADTADMQPKLGTPAASISADIAAVKAQTAAIETDTQDLQSRTPTALDNGYMPASVKRVATTTLAASGTGGQGYGAP